MKYLVLALLLTVFTAGASANDKEKVFAELIKKINSSGGVSFEFKSIAGAAFSGSIKAVRGNKYVLISGDRKIVSDGATVWNYSTKDNKVIISSFESGSSASIENIFFSFSENFKPYKLTTSNDSKTGKSRILYLKSDKSAQTMNVTEIQLTLDAKNPTIKAVRIIGSDGEQNFHISKSKLGAKFDSSIFTFKIPKDCEVVDLR